MNHLSLLFFLFVITIGFAFIGLFAYLNVKYKYPILRYHLIQLIAFSFFIILHSISLYGFINTSFYSDFWQAVIANTILSLYFVGPMIYYQGRIFFLVTGVEWTKKIQYVIFSLSLITPFMATLVMLQIVDPTAGVMSMGVWFFVLLSYYILLGLKYKSITDPLLKYLARIFLLFPLFFLPIAILDGILQSIQISTNEYPKGIMVQPLIYLVNNILSLLVLLKARKVYHAKAEAIPVSFELEYKITDREKEIVKMIMEGLSNKEIATKLFLSPSTVRNHISNIFEKTETRSRGKLQSLINSYLHKK